MKVNKIIKTCLIIVLVVIFTTSSYSFISNFIKEKEQDNEYVQLQEIIQSNKTERNNDEENGLSNENSKVSINLYNLYQKNNDLKGWIKIDGTNINYPVMQNNQLYLNKNFYKNNSSYGTPFLADYCDINTSDNLIIYGHHMKNGKMFANLEKYKDFNFYQNHKIVLLYTLQGNSTLENKYKIISCFKTTADENGFKYYLFSKANSKEDFNEYVKKCKELSFFNIEATAQYGDKLITLSTCEYSQKNGRIVVVAKKI